VPSRLDVFLHACNHRLLTVTHHLQPCRKDTINDHRFALLTHHHSRPEESVSWYAFLAVGEGSEQSKPVAVDLGKLAETGGTAAANDGTRSRKGKPERGRTAGQADQGGSPGNEPAPALRAVEDKK
jgi:hypothetical protein